MAHCPVGELPIPQTSKVLVCVVFHVTFPRDDARIHYITASGFTARRRVGKKEKAEKSVVDKTRPNQHAGPVARCSSHETQSSSQRFANSPAVRNCPPGAEICQVIW